MSITQESKQMSEAFVKKLEIMIGLIDDWSQLIPEGEYLKSMNTLKELFNMKGGFEKSDITITNLQNSNSVIRHHVRATQMRLREIKSAVPDADKLKNGWKMCPLCDSIVRDLWKHKQSKKCAKVYKSKHLSAKVSKAETSGLHTLIVSVQAWAEKTHRGKFHNRKIEKATE